MMTTQSVGKAGQNEAGSKRFQFKVGDTVRVHVKTKEGDKERIQVFTGRVIARKGHGPTETFTVRRISHGVGVERIFPVNSPYIAKIEVEATAKVRRAKLYFLRGKSGKKSRLKAGKTETARMPEGEPKASVQA